MALRGRNLRRDTGAIEVSQVQAMEVLHLRLILFVS